MNTDSHQHPNTGLKTKGRRSTVIQLFRYAVVGVMNTLLTLTVIFICKSFLHINPYVSNAIGYFLGLVNSFLWNRSWVFHAHGGKIHYQAVSFIIGFVVCYAIQFLVVWLLNQSSFGKIEIDILGFILSGYGIATLIGNVVYTLCNFVYNRLFAFKI
ncbi:MAG: GtrA family protein [Muribaculaceae bacterium]|nr:GtrA family protein [Muribaculaceae bacterium]